MSLSTLRKKIDHIDESIVALLNDRAQLSQEIGKTKDKNKSKVYVPHREREVFKRLKMLNKGPMSYEAFQAIYREIMSSSLALEKELRIANLGTQGSFTSIAARKKFGSQIEYVSCQSIWDVFHKVEHGECDYGVVPIENSTEGAVTHTFDMLVASDLKICSQVLLKISHTLSSKVAMKNIKNIYSNPQVFGQCRQWLQQHVPQAGQIWVSSTTEAVKMASRIKNAAAISSVEAVEQSDLKILARNLQDIPHNTTRFLIVAEEDAQPTGSDRTSILFSIKDHVGALHDMLVPFRKRKINLTKIESRPSKKRAWDYYFFVDFEGHRQDKGVAQALDELQNMCQYLKILGSYPVLK